MEIDLLTIFTLPGSLKERHVNLSNTRFLERKIWNTLVYVADRLKKLRGCGQLYLVNVKIVLM